MADRIDILDLIQIGQAPSTFFPEGMDAASFEAFTSIFATAASAEAGTVDLSGVVGAIEGQKAILDLGLTYEDGTTGEKLSLLNVCNQQVDLVRISIDTLREIIRQGLLDESGSAALSNLADYVKDGLLSSTGKAYLYSGLHDPAAPTGLYPTAWLQSIHELIAAGFISPIDGGSYFPALLAAMGTTGEELDDEDFASIWELQNEWMRSESARIKRIEEIIIKAQSADFGIEEDSEATRHLSRAIEGARSGGIPVLALLWKVYEGFSLTLEAKDAFDTLHSLYEKFFVEKEELKALPGEVSSVAGSSIALLEKLGALSPQKASMVSRIELAAEAIARVDRLVDRFRQRSRLEDGESGGGTISEEMLERIAQALEDLQYNDEEYQLPSGLKISRGGKLLGV